MWFCDFQDDLTTFSRLFGALNANTHQTRSERTRRTPDRAPATPQHPRRSQAMQRGRTLPDLQYLTFRVRTARAFLKIHGKQCTFLLIGNPRACGRHARDAVRWTRFGQLCGNEIPSGREPMKAAGPTSGEGSHFKAKPLFFKWIRRQT